MIGPNPMYIEAGIGNYSENGVSATDSFDGFVNFSSSSNLPATPPIGTYYVMYTATDKAGNRAAVNRTVIYRDTTPPDLELLGDQVITVAQNTPYIEPGYTAMDAYDGNETGRVQVNSTVDSGVVGLYRLQYSVNDSSGNAAPYKYRTVTVSSTAVPSSTTPSSQQSFISTSTSTTFTSSSTSLSSSSISTPSIPTASTPLPASTSTSTSSNAFDVSSPITTQPASSEATSTTSQTSSSSATSTPLISSSSSSTPAIAGAVGGGIALLIAVVIFVVFIRRSRSKQGDLWFHGPISSEEARYRLIRAGRIEGSFLVRDEKSSIESHRCKLHYVYKQNIDEVEIETADSHFFLTGSSKKFLSMRDLIAYLRSDGQSDLHVILSDPVSVSKSSPYGVDRTHVSPSESEGIYESADDDNFVYDKEIKSKTTVGTAFTGLKAIPSFSLTGRSSRIDAALDNVTKDDTAIITSILKRQVEDENAYAIPDDHDVAADLTSTHKPPLDKDTLALYSDVNAVSEEVDPAALYSVVVKKPKTQPDVRPPDLDDATLALYSDIGAVVSVDGAVDSSATYSEVRFKPSAQPGQLATNTLPLDEKTLALYSDIGGISQEATYATVNDASAADLSNAKPPLDAETMALYSDVGGVPQSEGGPDPSALYSVVNKDKGITRRQEPHTGHDENRPVVDDMSSYAPIDIFARRPVASTEQGHAQPSVPLAPVLEEETYGFDEDIV